MGQDFITIVGAPTLEYIAADYFTPGPSISPDEVRNDKSVAFSVQPVFENPQGSAVPYSPDFEDTDTFSMALGNPDETPTGGNVDLEVGSTTSGLTNLAYNIPAATLQTALNAALTTETKPLCSVVLLEAGAYEITGASNGAIATGFFSVTNAALLYPTSNAFFAEGSLGSATSRYQVMLIMRQAPMCYAEPTTVLDAADVQIVPVQAGAADANKIQRISFTVPQVYQGTYKVSAAAGGVTATCGIANPGMTPLQFALMLAQHPNINFQTDLEDNNVAVTQDGQNWTVEFIADLGNDNANALSVENVNLVGPTGKSGVMNYNTFNLYKYSLSQPNNTFNLTRVIQRQRVSGEVRTLYSETVTIHKDIIDVSTAVPTPLPSYYTTTQADALLLLKQNLNIEDSDVPGDIYQLTINSGVLGIELQP